MSSASRFEIMAIDLTDPELARLLNDLVQARDIVFKAQAHFEVIDHDRQLARYDLDTAECAEEECLEALDSYLATVTR